MTTPLQQKVRTELETLVKEGKTLAHIIRPPCDGKNHGIFMTKYQDWYTRTLPVVRQLAPDRLAEYVSCYERDQKRRDLTVLTYSLQDFAAGYSPGEDYSGRPSFDHFGAAWSRMNSQVSILGSLGTRIEGILNDIEGRIAAELQTAELDVARRLLKTSGRAAGAVAGVVLEDHLQRTASAHEVVIRKADPTIGELNDPLKAANVYDQPTWRRIQLLGDLRNLCAHKKSQEPTVAQVQDLLDGTAWVLGNVR